MATENRSKRLLLLLDLVAVTAAFFIAIFIRFHRKPGMLALAGMYEGLYYLVFELILAIYVAVFFINEQGNKDLRDQNPFEKVVAVVKNQLSLSVCLVVLLYLIKRGFWASRAVVIMLFVFGVFLDCFVRFLYGNYLRKKAEKEEDQPRYLLVTEDRKRTGILCKYLGVDTVTGVMEGKGFTPDTLPESCTYDSIITDSYGVSEILRKESLSHDLIISETDTPVSAEMTADVGDMVTVRYSGMSNRCSVLGVEFTVTNLPEAIRYVRDHIEEIKGNYICFGNVHTSVMAYENIDYRNIQNGALFVFPDGAPIYSEQRKKGFKRACRVAGPDFMKKSFVSAMDGRLSMYFYGSTEYTIHELERKLKADYPGISLKGFESPPFRELTPEEDEETVKRINDSGADILWIGLGAPKQEKWMATHKNRINALMLGVGAGFDFHAGTVKRAPVWIQKIGMEWFYRLCQDPRRLLKRYVVTNTKFFIYNLFDRKKGIS